jgi:capsule biosynthesis phosphatase
MIQQEKCIVIDIDGTLCREKGADESYAALMPVEPVLEMLRAYKQAGFYIILFTARNMRTFDGNVGRILARTGPVLMEWLTRHDVPFDELHFGKPWQGAGGFYVDDKAIRPSEFVTLSYDEIKSLLSKEKGCLTGILTS